MSFWSYPISGVIVVFTLLTNPIRL